MDSNDIQDLHDWILHPKITDGWEIARQVQLQATRELIQWCNNHGHDWVKLITKTCDIDKLNCEVN